MAAAPSIRRAVIRILLFTGALWGRPERLHGQPVHTTLGPFVLERVVHDRWVHAGQHPGFVAFDSVHHSIHLRASTSTALDGTRRLTMRLQNLGAYLSLDLTNRTRNAMIDQPPFTYSRYDDQRARAEMRRRRLHSQSVKLSLPAARFWEVPFVVPLTPLRTGVTWSDTLQFETEAEDLSELLSGVWQHEVTGDTVIDGRTLPVVRTQATLRYRLHDVTTDYALEEDLATTYDVSGRMAGTAVVDTAVGVRAAGADSALLTGTALLHLGGGRSVSSPVRYERRRSWLLRDSSAWALVQDSLRAAQRRQDTGMLMLPRTPLEERLRAGDLALADSLYARWRDTRDPNERLAIGRTLLATNARGAAGIPVDDRLRALRREAGDTAGYIAESLSALGRVPRYTTELVSYLDDPGRLWQLGILPRFTYVELAGQLQRATPILQPDSTRWQCDPATCRAYIALVQTAREPRLRDAALAGAFAREPARWYARLVARSDSGSLIARNALRLADGVGATWPAAPKTPMPQAGADWRTWLIWLGNQVRWDQSHRDAMLMYAARTGRNPVEELRRTWPPDADSARLVIGTILRGMQALAEPTPDELAAALLSASAADRHAAQRVLPDMMNRNGVPASDSLRSELLVPLLDAMARGANPPWLPSPGADARLHPHMVDFHGVNDVPVFVLDAELPRFVTTVLPSRFTLITRDAWTARPQREGGALITFLPTRVWDDFVVVGWNWTVFERRAASEAPSGYAGGGSYILLRTPSGWHVVYSSSWIT